LFVAGFGAAGYGTRRDLSKLARGLFWALLALVVFGVIAAAVQIPNGSVIYAVVGLVLFAGLIAYDFQRLRQASITHARAAVAVLAAHRAVQAQRWQAEHDDAERAARWHADDRHRADARSDAEGMCLQ